MRVVSVVCAMIVGASVAVIVVALVSIDSPERVHRIGDPWHPVRATEGECTGFAVPEYLIRRESGGNPSAYNPVGDTYGCAQVALDLYHPGRRCQGLVPFTIDGQRTCVARMVRKFGLTPWPEVVR